MNSELKTSSLENLFDLNDRAPRKDPAAGPSRAAFTADALSALTNLGYGQGDAAQAVVTVAAEQPDANTASLIRAALRLLAPKA